MFLEIKNILSRLCKSAGVFLLLAVALFSVSARAEQSADKILSNVSASFRKNGGISASFTLNANGRSNSGVLKSEGNRFAIVMRGYPSTWYDGKTMATYDPEHNEVTYSYPDVNEISAINPYILIGGYRKNFNTKLINSQDKSVYCILITPKSGRTGLKKVLLYINRKTLDPVKMIATASKSGTATISVANYKRGIRFRTSDFIFPTKSYKGVRINDMR